MVYKPNFNYGEFAIIKSQAGLNSYKISVKEWVEKTNAIGIMSKAGRYGGTYAHKDIAFEFGMWISLKFKLLIINAIINEFINDGLNQSERLVRLNKIAISQMKILNETDIKYLNSK